jgi:hypothetical protein
MGNVKGAATHYQQALALARQLGDKEAERELRDKMARTGKATGTDAKPARKR